MTQSARNSGRRPGVTAVSVVALTLLLAFQDAATAAPITILPPSTTVGVGESFSLDIGIGDVTPDLFAYQLDVAFDATILRADSIVDGGFLAGGGGISLFGGTFVLLLDNTSGAISILDSLLGPAPPATGAIGSGILARINFTALAPGVSAIALSNLILEDSSGNLLNAESGDGRVEVTSATAVPEPATSSLVLLGLGILWRSRRASDTRRAVATEAA